MSKMENGVEQSFKNQQFSDELSLYDLLQITWQQKWLVSLITFLFIALSGAYIYFTKPLYEAHVTITAPHLRDIAFLNPGQFSSGSVKHKTFNINEIYGIFAYSLLSEMNKELFFKEVFLPSLTEKQKTTLSQQKLYNLYSQELVIKKLPNTTTSTFNLIVKTDDVAKSREWVKQYIDLVSAKALLELNNSIKLHNLSLAKEIDLLKQAEEHNKLERMNQLQETLGAIKAAGLQHVSINLPPTSELQVMENKYDFYNKLHVSADDIRMFRVDGPTISSTIPVHPRVKIVLLLGVLMGLIVGFSAGLLRHTFK